MKRNIHYIKLFAYLIYIILVIYFWVERMEDLSKRSSEKELTRQIKYFSEQLIYKQLFDKIPDLILILNQNRQAVFANKSFFKTLDFVDQNTTYGKRPGDIFSCTNSMKSHGGCGNASECQYCGAFLCIVDALSNKEGTRECHILDADNSPYTLRVTASPIFIDEEKFIIFTLFDISEEKRKEILERVFFHDILNTANSITSISMILEMDLPDEYSDYKKMLKDSSKRLIDEILNHKQLLQAENGNLNVQKVIINSKTFIRDLIVTNSMYSFAKESRIIMSENFTDFNFESDQALLGRVISNLLKNALEAVYPSGTVTVNSSITDTYFMFSVHNKQVMPAEIKSMIFRKSFSTKGNGRGIGTYSIKLFTEKYLKGKTWFESNEEQGTTFYVQFKI